MLGNFTGEDGLRALIGDTGGDAVGDPEVVGGSAGDLFPAFLSTNGTNVQLGRGGEVERDAADFGGIGVRIVVLQPLPDSVDQNVTDFEAVEADERVNHVAVGSGSTLIAVGGGAHHGHVLGIGILLDHLDDGGIDGSVGVDDEDLSALIQDLLQNRHVAVGVAVVIELEAHPLKVEGGAPRFDGIGGSLIQEVGRRRNIGGLELRVLAVVVLIVEVGDLVQVGRAVLIGVRIGLRGVDLNFSVGVDRGGVALLAVIGGGRLFLLLAFVSGLRFTGAAAAGDEGEDHYQCQQQSNDFLHFNISSYKFDLLSMQVRRLTVTP